MNKKGKLENVKREMERYNISILGLSEVRWEGEGEFESRKYKITYKGGEKNDDIPMSIHSLLSPLLV
ncbi:hypothetical protein J437_LFUL005445 [Ladona fulva]|uniref:Uncharacterized protein n=1 Tax=Ladona fulva TaxID=123851 RepID=A0A8K0NX18_LADFU|nr:hypothetical protein J437_LFUL005445 [Ladona fulva]